jgi:magnesium transporter
MMDDPPLAAILFTRKNIADYDTALNSLSPIELTELITEKPKKERLLIFNQLTNELQVRTFENLHFGVQKEILATLPSEVAARLLNDLSPDDRTAFFEELPSEVVNQLLKLLSPPERAVTLKLLGYPEGSVGRLMTPDYIAVKSDWTVREALNFIRNYGHDSETINVIYVVDEKGKLIDDIKIREFLFASLDAKVYDITDHTFIALNAYDDQDKAIALFKVNDRVALPVVDNQGLLLGIVTIDDILNVVGEEDTEAFQKVGGSEALEEPYMDTPFFHLMRKRIGWLVILFLGEMLTASAMGFFEEEISKAVVLALFIPLIISSGGNSGSQASTLIIRAMALGEVTLKDWFIIMRRELLAGVFLGTCLGLIGFMRVSLWSAFSDVYGAHWLLVAITVFLALIGVVLWGTLTGSMLPLLLKRLGADPATSSAPFVATLVDVTGLIIYFSIAIVTLRGVLL